MSRLLIRNVAVLVVPESGECRVDEAQDIQIDNGRITAITPAGAPPTDPRLVGAGEWEVVDGVGLLACRGW
jgi:5-methylthioadenosine/S-adenosylhomocysteine deaminase